MMMSLVIKLPDSWAISPNRWLPREALSNLIFPGRHLHITHSGLGRSCMALLNERIHGGRFARKHSFHRAVLQVSNPSVHTQLLCPVDGPVAEVHSLNFSFDDHVDLTHNPLTLSHECRKRSKLQCLGRLQKLPKLPKPIMWHVR